MEAPISIAQENEMFRLRSYQTEMLEKSLKKNIIVAMDTGSGKTHIAISRARTELETCDPYKIVWFIAPTVALCNQQYQVFQTLLPAYQARKLTSMENVDTWTDQRTWDAVLYNMRVVVSTPDVLAQALTHGFVPMTRLALLIFDEAHHCTKNHPMNRIMKDFYHRMRRKDPSLVPPILGLTASPVINSNPKALQTIEQNLDSHVTIPKIHQTEFLQHVHRPNLEPVFFQVDLPVRNVRGSAIMTALQEAYHGYDLASDPYIQDLYERMRYDPTAECKLSKAFAKESTYCLEQLKSIQSRAYSVCEQLGAFAAERYIVRCVDRLKDAAEMNEESQMLGWSGREKTHLMALLRKIVAPVSSGPPAEGISAKATALISYLKKAYHKDFRGLIFAERRAVVNALEDVIRNDPDLKQSFQVGAFVGTSSSSSRSKDVAELVDIKGQDQTLKDFREGRKNLIVTTSVLEEGIDVPNCNVVICFDALTNLKMYVQRRGRARKMASNFMIMIPQNALESSSVTEWSTLEQILKEEYADESRQIKPMNSTELIDEADDYSLYVDSTQALLTSDGALPHLFHFCATLRTGPHTDHRPEFKLDTDDEGCFSAEVTLPLAVDASLRRHKGISKWKNEKDARKDAAFQAYKALHEAGLIGSNLLPLHGEVNGAPQCDMIDDRPAMVPVNPRIDPWALHATAIGNQRYAYRIRFSSTNHSCEFDVMTTMPLPTIPPYNLYWNKSLVYEVSYELQRDQPMHIEDDLVASLQKVTYHLLSSSLGSHRLVSNKFDFVVLLLPNIELSTSAVDDFVATTSGARPATILEKYPTMDGHSSRLGLVRRHGASERFMLQKINERVDEQSQGSKEYVLKVSKFPKRKDFLHQVDAREKQNPAYTAVLELELADSVIEMLPADLVTAVTFAPCVLHRLEVYMVAQNLSAGIFAPVGFTDVHLVLTALCATSAREHVNYQRMEYLGDALLKFASSIRLMARNLTWPESYLTAEKGRTVSNGYLAKASLDAGLDQYIIRTGFTGAKWQPQYLSDVHARQYEKQEAKQKDNISTKTLADVVESLIGASYLSRGRISDALTCMQILLPREPWLSIHDANKILFSAAPEISGIPPSHFKPVEELLGHTFDRVSILTEALTHPSYSPPHHERISSYQRLEFLGDAVIDYIISTRLYAHNPPLSHVLMHTFRTALVNGYLLAFLMFELKISEVRYELPTTAKRKWDSVAEPGIQDFTRSLYQFLRHNSPELLHARHATHARHMGLRAAILEALYNGHEYPWAELEQARAEKVFSDIVESAIGAIYIDSHGSFEACEKFLEKLGLFKAMQRMVAGQLDCLHPKERLGQLAVNDKVLYEHVKKSAGAKAKPGHSSEGSTTSRPAPGYVCRVRVGDNYIGDAVEGVLRSETETLAAWRACQVIRTQMSVDNSTISG